jgi:hypothetical protein
VACPIIAGLAYYGIVFMLGRDGIPFIGQDCGSGEFDVIGIVRDESMKPIPNAKIRVHVTFLGCENSRPSSDLNIVSDQQGHFRGVKGGITEGDTFEIVVSADGYETYRKTYGVWEFIYLPEAKGLQITLSSSGEWF